MNMFLTILLLVLKILGITLLSIFLLLFILFLLVLFWPVKYKGQFDYNNKAISISGSVSWLGIFRIIINKEDKLVIKLKALFFTIYNSNKPAKANKIKSKNKEEKAKEVNTDSKSTEVSSTIKESVNDESKIDSIYNEASNKEAAKTNENKADSVSSSGINSHSDNSENEIPKSFEEVEKNNNETKDYSCENSKEDNTKTDNKSNKIKNIINLIQSEEFKYAFDKVKSKLIKLLKIVLPRKWNINALVGFDDPATTGAVLAISGMLYPLIKNHISVCGDFENANICINGKARGRITVVKAIFIACSLFFDKRIRYIIREFKEV